ncbi:MAG: hypothetical protein FJ399_14165 [Verrucomicrobia bacterium]|nr:hypothetical protein [Verrucomicrobiota bacterium]
MTATQRTLLTCIGMALTTAGSICIAVASAAESETPSRAFPPSQEAATQGEGDIGPFPHRPRLLPEGASMKGEVYNSVEARRNAGEFDQPNLNDRTERDSDLPPVAEKPTTRRPRSDD